MLTKIHPPGAGNSFISSPKQGIAEDADHLSKIRFLLTGKEREMVAGCPPPVSSTGSIASQSLYLPIPSTKYLRFTLVFAQVPNISRLDS